MSNTRGDKDANSQLPKLANLSSSTRAVLAVIKPEQLSSSSLVTLLNTWAIQNLRQDFIKQRTNLDSYTVKQKKTNLNQAVQFDDGSFINLNRNQTLQQNKNYYPKDYRWPNVIFANIPIMLNRNLETAGEYAMLAADVRKHAARDYYFIENYSAEKASKLSQELTAVAERMAAQESPTQFIFNEDNEDETCMSEQVLLPMLSLPKPALLTMINPLTTDNTPSQSEKLTLASNKQNNSRSIYRAPSSTDLDSCKIVSTAGPTEQAIALFKNLIK
jgi:hypothetical protein